MRRWIVALTWMLAESIAFHASVWGAAAASTPVVRTATPAEARAVLSAEDDYVRAMSDADVSIRMQDPNATDRAALRVRMGASARAFSAAEGVRLKAMMARTGDRVAALGAWLPATVLLIKSNEELDGGWPHTRANAIIFGAGLPPTDADLDNLFFHELWHVISRANPDRMDAVYALLGFVPCVSVTGSAGFETPTLTNPDAPIERHVLPLPGPNGGYALPTLRAAFPRFRPEFKDFGDYIKVQFVGVERDAMGRCAIEQGPNGPLVVTAETVGPVLAALGTRDTAYVWHPEEMTADLFALSMTAPDRAKDRHQLDRLMFLLGAAP